MEDNFQSGDCTTVEGLQNIITKQKEEICALKTEVDKLSCKLKEKENPIALLENEDNSQKIIEDLKDTTQDLQYENKCLRACLLPISPQADNAALLEIELKNNEKLQKKVAELTKTLADQNFWKIENSDVYQGLRRQYNVLEAKNDEQQYMIKSLLETEKRLKNVETDYSTLHAKYQQTLQKNNLLQSGMQIDIQQYKDLVKELENENFLLKEKLRESKTACNANAADKIVILEDKVNQLHDEKKALETKLQADREKLGNILGRLEQNIQSHKKQKNDLHSELDQLNLKVCELHGRNSALEAQLEERSQIMEGVTNNRIIQLQNEVAIYKTDKMLLEERLNAFNKQHDDIVNQIKGCAMKQVEHESEIIQLQACLNKEQLARNQIEYQLAESKEHAEELKNDFKEKTALLEKEMSQTRAKNNVLEKERDLVICENNELTLRIADLQKNSSKLTSTCVKLDSINKENSALRSELEVMKKQFQGKITNARIIIQQLKSENSSLKTQINDLIKTMKVEDNIDLLVQDRLIEKKSLHEKIQQLETKYQELEVKYCKCKDEFAKQSKYYKDQMEDILIDKNTEIQSLKEANNQNLTLAKMQYDKDLQFIHGRHNEAITKLQAMHEENMNEKVGEHDTEIEDIRAQKQAYRDALRKLRREVEELRDQLSTQQKEYTAKIEDMKRIYDADRKRSTENITKLAKKCWLELEKIQVVNKENLYMQKRAQKEILLASKTSEMNEIEEKLKNIKIEEVVENADDDDYDDDNLNHYDKDEANENKTVNINEPSCSCPCHEEESSNLCNKQQSECRGFETGTEITLQSNDSYENNKTQHPAKTSGRTTSTEEKGISDGSGGLGESSYVTISSESFSHP